MRTNNPHFNTRQQQLKYKIMYTIIKAQNIDAPQSNWELIEFSKSVEDILQTWAYVVDYLKVCYKDCLIQPCEDGHSPYEVTVTTSYKGIDLSAEAYISGKVAYKLITE